MAVTKHTSRNGLQFTAASLWIAALLCLIYYGFIAFLMRMQILESTSSWSLSRSLSGFGALVIGGAAVAVTAISLLFYVCDLHANLLSAVTDLRKLLSGQTQTEAVLTQMNENMLLSDRIKSIAFREKDRMVLEEAIQQDIRMEQWDSAQRLINALADEFGCDREAEDLRQEMVRYRNSNIQEKVDTTIKHINSLWMIHRYDEAEREVQGLLRLYPGDPRVLQLRGQTEAHCQNYKKELLDLWDQAVRNNEIDRGVELLKKLDAYLTPTEAAALEESARGVFRAKLHNMGVQFSLFVTEKKWENALQIGRQIIEEYPNSRMAQEVRDKIDALSQRAND